MGTPTAATDPKQVDLFEATQNVIALAFQLPVGEIPQLPEQVLQSLNSAEVKKAIESVLDKYLMSSMGRVSTGQLTDKEAKAFVDSLQSGGTKAAQEVLIGKIKDTTEYRRLMSALNDFKASLSHSPLGVWVDHNKGVVIVTGAVLAIGGTIALFYTRAGGPFVEFPVSQIKGKAIQLWSPGKFTLSGKLLEFQPAVSLMGIEVIGEQKWDRLKLTLNLGVVANNKGVKEVEGKAVAVFDKLTLKADASVLPMANQYKLGVGFELGKGAPGSIDLSVHGIVTDGRLTGGDVNATYKATQALDFTLKGEKDQTASSVMLMARLKFL